MKSSHIKKLERFRVKLSEMRDALDDMSVEYRDKYDNASESWQLSDAGAACDNDRETLEMTAAEVESAEGVLADICAEN